MLNTPLRDGIDLWFKPQRHGRSALRTFEPRSSANEDWPEAKRETAPAA